ncbi:MAG: CDP-alcohol phosphatidyltransferase family protein [Methanomicrobiales archaeon]|nr:CDP-alcohol phosphatidyltransferase family protein [Methanomicrobiales archaeon]
MNITALRPRLMRYLEPVANLCVRAGLTPNQISVLSIGFAVLCAILFLYQHFVLGALALFTAAVLDLVDGSVARKMQNATRFGAAFDWIADKYVDALAILGAGFSGIAILTRFWAVPPAADLAVVALAVFGSMMNTFIKPVVYAEVGFTERKDGKIDDPLEGIGFFGRPETIIVLLIGAVTGFLWLAILLIAVCTNLSAIQRIGYLHGRLK